MKAIVKFLPICFILLSVFSCKDEVQEQGSAVFEFSPLENDSTAKSTIANLPDNLEYVVVSIRDASGNVVLQQEHIQLTRFNSNYLSEPLALAPGYYQLTEFMVADTSDAIRYAAPNTGSPLAYLVNQPLPFDFSVSVNQVVKVIPEVLSTADRQPGDFGFATFGLSVTEIFDFFVTPFIYNDSTENMELTEASIKVTSNSETVYEGNLKAITNRITLIDNRSTYTVTVTKPKYKTYHKNFSSDELKTHFSNPLSIVLTQDVGLIAYYPFDGDALDYSGNGNHCVEHSAGNYVPGIQGEAHHFDGLTDYLQLSQTLNGSQGLSFSFWLNTKGVQPGQINGSVISKYNMYSDYTCFFIASWSHFTQVSTLHGDFFASRASTNYRDAAWSEWTSVADIPSQINSGNYVFAHPSTVAQNEWVHCVINCTPTEIQVWINGQLCVSKTREYAAYLEDANEPTYIGNTFNGGQGNNNHYYGALDELRIYSRGLTPMEIQQLAATSR